MEGVNVVKTDRFKRIQGAHLRIGDKIYPVYKGVNTVGRNKVATINIKHLNVSQNQAIIILVDDQQHFISDVNSSNGTFLHDAELVPFKLYELTSNTKITFGDVVGTYFKISNDTTLNLTETAEMTQDITQNFYASNTQLIFDQTVAPQSKEHSYSNTILKAHQLASMIPEDIHELETQVVEYPSQRVEQNCNVQPIQTENLEECVIEEPVDTYIHDAPTQVINFSETHESTHSLEIHCEKVPPEDIEVITGFKELHIDSENKTTQVAQALNDVQTSQNSGSNEATQILNEEETQQAIELINTSIQKNVEDEQPKSNVLGSGETTQIVNEKETQKVIEIINQSLRELHPGKEQKKNIFHSSQTPCSSGLNRNTTFANDDSLLDARRHISILHGDIEDTFVDESFSNDSVDFLTMQKQNDDGKENISSSASRNESPMNQEKKVPVEGSSNNKFNHDSSVSGFNKNSPNLPIEKSCTNDLEDANLDCDTDMGDLENMLVKTQPKKLDFDDTNTDEESLRQVVSRKKLLKALNSDSDTDIEDTQDVGFRKKPLRKLNSEDLTQPKIIDHVSGSDTDCEEDIKAKGPQSQPVKENKKLDIDSGSDTDIDVDKHDGDLNDTDCIPATQDAFAEAFDYKAQRTQNSCYQSSEESFKLGITELLEDSIENKGDVEVNREKQTGAVEESTDKNNESNNVKNDGSPITVNEVSEKHSDKKKDCNFENKNENRNISEMKKDDIYILPTQIITNDIENPEPTSEDHSPDRKEETPIIATENDVYSLATQKMDSLEDVFTDFKAPSRIFTFKKKSANLEDSLTTILSNNKKVEEDIYLMATQNINESKTSSSDQNDDVYLEATQKLDMAQGKNKYDVFSQPTQCLNSENRFKPVQLKDDDEDIYAAATQQIDTNLLKIANTKGVEPYASKDQEEAYMQDTQKIPENIQIVEKTNSARGDTANPSSTSINVFNLDTQVNDTQSEMPFADENIKLVVAPRSDRPQNPLIRVLNDQSKSEEEVNSNDSSAKRSRNIEEDIQESPSKKIKSVHMESSLDRIGSCKNNVETLSQIEDFIKKPLDIVPLSRKSTKKRETVLREEPVVQKDDVETLSQIEAFIKKPLEVPKYRKSMRTESKPVVEVKPDTSETLSQIEALVKQPFQKVGEKEKKDESATEMKNSGRHRSSADCSTSVTENEAKDDQRVSRRISKRRVSNTQGETKAASDKDKLDVIKEYNEADDFEDPSEQLSRTKGKEKKQSRVNDDENPEKSNSFEDSRYLEVKSDVDQSFALLESKCSKVRRQPCKDPVLNEIKVSVTSHRRSVSTAETSKKSSAEVLFPSRKSSRRTTFNNNIIPTTTGKKKRKAETIVDDKKGGSTDSESEFSDSGISAKISRKSSRVDKRIGDGYSVNEGIVTKQQPSSSKRISRNMNNIRKTDDNGHTYTKSEKPSSSDDSKMNLKASRSTKKAGYAKIVSTSEESDEINQLPNDNENKHVLITRGKPLTLSSSESIVNNSRKTNRITNLKVKSTSEESGTSNDSPTPLKQKTKSARGESTSRESIATPRRGQRSMANETLLGSAERSKRKQRPKVVFTMLESPQLESFIKYLGGSVVDTVDSATVLVTEHVKRSQKLLTAVAQGKPICSPNWIQASKKVNEFVDPWDYILTDKEAETRWSFSLKESLLRAAGNKLLVDYTFQLMVTNAADVLKGAIEASGGKCVTRNPGKNFEDKFVIVASPEHKTKYTKMKKQNPNITIIEPEAIFDGVLRQELRFSRHLVS